VSSLDGQQRLTAFAIGLNGSYWRRKRGKWRDKPESYSEYHLYLNVAADPDRDLTLSEEMQYLFKFRSRESSSDVDEVWMKVEDIHCRPEEELLQRAEGAGAPLDIVKTNMRCVKCALRYEKRLAIEQVSAMPERTALSLFIRRNSGGVPLKRSEIIFSQLAVYWEEGHPKEEIEEYQLELANEFGKYGFGFSKTFLVRALLMLADERPSFRVENFSSETIGKMEEVWRNEAFKSAIGGAVNLIAEERKLSKKCLGSSNLLLPVIYFFYKNRLRPGVCPEEAAREMEYFLTVMVCQRLSTTVGLETWLRRAQDVLRDQPASEFPARDVLQEVGRSGVSADLDRDRLCELIKEVEFGNAQVDLLLTKLYDGCRMSGEITGDGSIQVDHFFPKSRLGDIDFLQDDRGLDEDQAKEASGLRNRLANLQLIPDNQRKKDRHPRDWLEEKLDGESMAGLAKEHCLPWDEIAEYRYDRYTKFLTERQKKMHERLVENMVLKEDVVSS